MSLEFKYLSEIQAVEANFILKSFLPIPKNAVTLLSASGGTGKTRLSLLMADRHIQATGEIVALWLTEDYAGQVRATFDEMVKNNLARASSLSKMMIIINEPPQLAKREQVIIKAGAVIGGDGFGWAPHQGRWEKIPQLGRVVIGNRVSIGNNVTIDRGALKDTQIGDDCIIDNLVHIAHNVQLGAGTAVVAQTGISGSTTIGKHNIIAGQVGFAGHIETVDGCQFMAKSGVTHSIKQPGSYSGFPAQPTAEWQKNTVRSRQLDKMAKQLKMLQKQLAELESKF